MPSRRSVLAALGAGLAALGGCSADSSTLTTTRTGAPPSTDTSTATSTTTTDGPPACDTNWTPEPAWSVEAASVGVPVYRDDHVFVAFDGEARALAAADGTVSWRTAVGGSHVYAVSDGVVLAEYSGDGTAGTDGVIALDAGSGDRLWSFTQPGETAGKPRVAAIHDGTAYVATGHVPMASTDPDPAYGRLYVFDLASGDQRAVHDLTRDDEDWLHPVSVLADDTGVYVTREAGGVLGATQDGTVRWRRAGDDWYYEAVRAGDVLVQPQSRQVIALDVETGETVWTDDRLDQHVAAADGVVYGTSSGSPETYATVAAVDATTADARWTSELDGCGGSIAVGGGVVATGVGCRQSRVDLYDAETGCRYGGVDGGSNERPGLAVSDDALYVARFGDTEELVALPLP